MPGRKTRSTRPAFLKSAGIWIVLLVVVVVTGGLIVRANRNADSPSAASASLTQTALADPATNATPVATHTGQCAYTWAYQDHPSLTEQLTTSLQTFIPDAETLVQNFGEDCTYPDGQKVFTPLETDFYVRFHVKDLKDEEALGNWILQIMPRVFRLPRDQVQGSHLGFVEITFIHSETDKLVVRVPVQQYQEQAGGRTGKNLFRLFAVPIAAPT